MITRSEFHTQDQQTLGDSQFSKNLAVPTLNILGAIMITRRKFHTQDQQILGASQFSKNLAVPTLNILGATENDLVAQNFYASAVTPEQIADCFRCQVPNVKPYGPHYYR